MYAIGKAIGVLLLKNSAFRSGVEESYFFTYFIKIEILHCAMCNIKEQMPFWGIHKPCGHGRGRREGALFSMMVHKRGRSKNDQKLSTWFMNDHFSNVIAQKCSFDMTLWHFLK